MSTDGEAIPWKDGLRCHQSIRKVDQSCLHLIVFLLKKGVADFIEGVDLLLLGQVWQLHFLQRIDLRVREDFRQIQMVKQNVSE